MLLMHFRDIKQLEKAFHDNLHFTQIFHLTNFSIMKKNTKLFLSVYVCF
jgi:hypothetical protein